MQTCPSCGQENPAGFRLCGMCGAALTSDAPAAREERKVVTILFTDLVGSTAAAERLDPEDVRKILSPYYSRLRAEIERHGGTVEKFIGDAVMAVFGAPVAHEDDPERAVRAALAIREALADSDLQIRTAVNTGEALVALGARPSEGEGMVSGDVVNTAARLQSAAPVDGILVGEPTYRATRDAIEYRDAEAVSAKGKSEPVRVWEVVGARAAFGSDVEQKPRTPLVGRTRERALLQDALARARSEESVQLVTVVGVPGIGKSRLVAELFQIVEADPDLISWRQGRSLPYGERVSFWALGEVVKGHAGILESDSAADAEAKLTAMLDAIAADEQERIWLAKHARPLVGLEGDAQADRSEAFSAWRRLIEAAAEQRPLVVVFEDLHWADDALLDFVDHLADWATTVPLLIVATARPELLDRRPGWGGGKRNAYTLSLGALSDDETAQLLHQLLDRAVLPADAQREVLRRADGNPLYAEEYARMLQDSDGGELPLPESVQGLIAARIDGLAPAEKALLQDASVIGKVFWPAAVGGAQEQLLHSLERKEFVRRERRSAIAGETQYAFLHALVRDVAYGQIPRAQRVERHRRAAEWLGGLSGDRSEDRAEMLAHHYREALALADAAGVDATGLREPAKRAFADASERALALNAWSTAVELAREGLALAGDDDPLRPHLQLRLADAASQLDEFDIELATEARAAFLARGEIEKAAEAEILLSWLSFWSGGGAEAPDHAAHAVELLEGRPPSPLQARAIARHARRTVLAGHDEEALQLAEQALELAERFGDERVAADALNTMGLCRANLRDHGGLDDLRQAATRGEREGAPQEQLTALNNLMNCLWKFGRLAAARDTWAEIGEVAMRHGATTALSWHQGEGVLDAFLRGELHETLHRADTALVRVGHTSSYSEIGIRCCRSAALGTRGRADEALADAARALERATEIADPQVVYPALGHQALALFLAGRRDETLTELARFTPGGAFLRLPDFTAMVPLLAVELGRPDLYTDAAHDLRRPTIWDDAAAAATAGDLVGAAELFERIGARLYEAWSRLLAAEGGDPSQLEPARAYFAAEGATAFSNRCDALLSASA